MSKIIDYLRSNSLALILLFLFVSVILYSQIITAPPIWDDVFFIFDFQPFKDGITYAEIWTNFAWPLSASLYKATLSIFGTNYTFYHILNLITHTLNSFLVYKILKKLDLPFALCTGLIFLIHPANIISVAWMIQIKTLLSFLLFAGSVYFYVDFFQTKKKLHLIPFIILFILSLLTKSTALFLPLVLFFIHLCYKQIGKKSLMGFALFLAISLWGGLKLINSPIVAKYHQSETQDLSVATTVVQRIDFGIQSIWYYLEQAFFPSNFIPVKGIITESAPLTLIALSLFLVGTCILLRLLDLKYFVAFISSLILMIPFLGIIKAPFMKITSVSDQHLYLILPLLIWIFIGVLSLAINSITKSSPTKLSSAHHILLAFFISYLSSSTFFNAKVFESEETFYQLSLDYNPRILSFYINLTSYYQENDNFEAAYKTIQSAIDICQQYPELKQDQMYHYIGAKWFEIEQIKRRKDAYNNQN